jgi:hypothetical protein
MVSSVLNFSMNARKREQIEAIISSGLSIEKAKLSNYSNVIMCLCLDLCNTTDAMNECYLNCTQPIH